MLAFDLADLPGAGLHELARGEAFEHRGLASVVRGAAPDNLVEPVGQRLGHHVAEQFADAASAGAHRLAGEARHKACADPARGDQHGKRVLAFAVRAEVLRAGGEPCRTAIHRIFADRDGAVEAVGALHAHSTRVRSVGPRVEMQFATAVRFACERLGRGEHLHVFADPRQHPHLAASHDLRHIPEAALGLVQVLDQAVRGVDRLARQRAERRGVRKQWQPVDVLFHTISLLVLFHSIRPQARGAAPHAVPRCTARCTGGAHPPKRHIVAL